MTKLYFTFGFLLFYIASFAQSFDAELISQKTSIEVNKGNLTKELSYEIKINNRAGDKYTRISIPFSKSDKISKLEAYILDSNRKTVKKLKKSDVTERSLISDFSFYEDDFVKEFTLRYHAYPYTIVYSYRIQTNEFINIDYWYPIINEDIPTRKAKLVVTVPNDYEIRYRNEHVEPPVIYTSENTINYYWIASYDGTIENEILSPPIQNFLPHVEIVPVVFDYEKEGSFKDWVSYGNWEFKLLEDIGQLTNIEKAKVSVLVKNIKDGKEKIKILFHYLQDETRYINVSIGTGGLKPYPASYVCQNKFGDCKALANYFKAILDYVGISSYYTNVNAGSPISVIDSTFPSQQFNHVILYIPLKSDTLWLDCTSDAPFNYLGTFTQNRNAFVISENNSRFIRTPSLKPGDVVEVRKIETNSYNANVEFTNTYRGGMYEKIFQLEHNFNGSDKSNIIKNYIVADGFQMMDYKINSSDRDSAKIELSYIATASNIYNQYGNDMLLSNIPFSLPDFEKPQERKLPVQIDYPIYQIDTIVYEIPEGYTLNTTSEPYKVTNKYGAYSIAVQKREGNIITTKSLLINAGYYPHTEYADFYNFYTKIIESENRIHITLTK